MSIFSDKILRGGEITAQGKFKGNGAFYIALAPKTTDASSVVIMNVKLSGNKDFTDFPFSVGVWNPIVVNEVDVTQANLTNYRIFWGEE